MLAVTLGVRAGGHDDWHDHDDDSNDVEFTWMSIANWYFKIGDLRIVMDGYITRVPGPPFFVPSPEFPADQFAFTIGPRTVEVGSTKRVVAALPARAGNARSSTAASASISATA